MNEQSEYYTFFLSYASDDIDYASRLKNYLEDRSYTVWFDRQNILWADDLREIINLGLTNSLYGIVVLSRHYLAPHKTWTIHEFYHLINNHKIYIILHNIERQHIQIEYPDVYRAIEGLLVIEESSQFSRILQELQRIIAQRVEERFVPLYRHLSKREWDIADLHTCRLIDTKELFNSSQAQEDLIKLDSLWRICSSDYFGFKIQQKIYRKAREQFGNNYLKSYDYFCGRVSWHGLNTLLYSSNANTPAGHFPRMVYFKEELGGCSSDRSIIEHAAITKPVYAPCYRSLLPTAILAVIFVVLLQPLDWGNLVMGIPIYFLMVVVLMFTLPVLRHRRRVHHLHEFINEIGRVIR
jgi:hypothetical protein